VKVEHIPEKVEPEKKKVFIDQTTMNHAYSQVLSLLYDNESSWPFHQPVSLEEAEDYYDIIKNPMDFSTMKNKISNSRYTSKEQFVTDLILIWENCKSFNDKVCEIFN
jgi:histone acetyltransferase